MKTEEKSIEKAASTLVGLRLDPERGKGEIPFPTKQVLDRKFKMDVDHKGKASLVEVE